MAEEMRNRGMTRRAFAKLAGTGALVAGGPAFLFPERARAAGKTLKIMQWSHFVPAYDKWFDGAYTKEWGEKNDTNVIVDNIAIGELNARAAAEVSAKKGHDLFMFLSPPAAYEKQVIDHREIYEEVEKKHGKKIDLARQVDFNPKTKKYFAFSDSYVPDPGNYGKDLWAKVGFPERARTPGTTCASAARRSRIKIGNPVRDRPFAGARHEHGDAGACSGRSAAPSRTRTATSRSTRRQTIEALKYMKRPVQGDRDRRGLHLGSVVEQPGDARRQALVRPERDLRHPHGGEGQPRNVDARSAPAGAQGPVRRIAAEHVMDCYVIWKFAENKEGAKKFLIDYIDNFHDGLPGGRVLQLPVLPLDRPGPQEADRERSDGRTRRTSTRSSGNVLDWATNVGYPGLRDRRHRRSVQHLGHPDDVRQGRAQDDQTPGGRREGGRKPSTSASSPSGSRRRTRRWRSSKPGGSRRSSSEGSRRGRSTSTWRPRRASSWSSSAPRAPARPRCSA